MFYVSISKTNINNRTTSAIYVDAGMEITSYEDVEKVLKTIGFYRLRGYSFHLYDNTTKKYVAGTKFKDIIKLYQFDQELSALLV